MSVNDLAGFNERAEPAPEGVPAALPFDAARYRPLLGKDDLTDEQADELLRTLFEIMRSFVELGFSVDLCGKLLDDSEEDSEDGPDGVGS